MYDGESLRALFSEAGFADVRELGLWESSIAGIEAVEREGRARLGVGVCVEASKLISS
jgi:hypothetical protein